MNDQIVKLRGCYHAQLLSAKDGSVVEERIVDNVVVTAGRRFVLSQLISSNIQTAQVFSHIAVGTSTTAPATSDTALGSEHTRIAISGFTTTNLTANPPSWRAECSFATNQANTTIGEVGMFNSNAGGTMLSHSTFGTVNKTTSNVFSVSYTISG
jgi:hypothetical protein